MAAVFLAALTVAPVRFVYPNLAPRGWKLPLLGGAWLWALVLLASLRTYPDVPAPLLAAAVAYPVVYTVVSIVLDVRSRRSA